MDNLRIVAELAKEKEQLGRGILELFLQMVDAEKGIDRICMKYDETSMVSAKIREWAKIIEFKK